MSAPFTKLPAWADYGVNPPKAVEVTYVEER